MAHKDYATTLVETAWEHWVASRAGVKVTATLIETSRKAIDSSKALLERTEAKARPTFL